MFMKTSECFVLTRKGKSPCNVTCFFILTSRRSELGDVEEINTLSCEPITIGYC